MYQRPSAYLASVAVLMLAAGLLLFHFTRSTSAPAAPPSAPSITQAIAERSLDRVKAAIAAGSDVNTPLPDGPNAGMTPLHLAAATPAPFGEAIRALVAAGALVDTRTIDGRTPLMLAAEFGHPTSIAALANAGAAVDARDQAGRSALHYAAAAGRTDGIAALLAAGASINTPDDAGATALAAACSSHAAAQVINALAGAGADVDAADSAGVTPLMRAAETGQPDKVMALLNAGAATRTKAADNRSALDRARAAAGDAAKRCVEILERAAP